ncbi:MAG: hypothetical protein KAH01_00165 [Caldisericia bacterium]|nr:hypothetical protein [Caldisericia bacterium]
MKKNQHKQTIIFILLTLALSTLFFYVLMPSITSKKLTEVANISFKKGFYYKITSWDKIKKSQNLYFEDQELTEESKNALEKEKIMLESKEEKVEKEESTPSFEEKVTIKRPWAQIFASLTGSAGSLGISGTARNADIYFNEVNRGNAFSGGAGSSFTVFIDSGSNNRNVSLSSPAFAVNSTVKSLSIGIDPYSMYMTLSGRVELDLPGDIVGTLYNTTNGSAGGTTLNNGYFSVSVPLSFGENNITASGKWMTIELQLPTISVIITR